MLKMKKWIAVIACSAMICPSVVIPAQAEDTVPIKITETAEEFNEEAMPEITEIPLSPDIPDKDIEDSETELYTSDGSVSLAAAESGWWWPCPSALSYSSDYGMRWGRLHRGVDIPGAKGAQVIASRSGIARIAYPNNPFYNDRGRCIVIDHEDGYYSVYQHLSGYAINDNVRVNRGQVIGYVGGSGSSGENTYAAHLHFEMHRYDVNNALTILNLDWSKGSSMAVTSTDPKQYIDPNNPTPNSTTSEQKPSNPKLSIYTNNVAVGQPILFEYSVNNAANMYIAIDVDGTREHFIEVSGDHYNGTFTKPGHYVAALWANNSIGDSGFSNWVEFDVYNTPPQNTQIKLDGNFFHSGSKATFEFDAQYASDYQIAIYCNNQLILSSDRIKEKNFTTTLTTSGHYYAYVSAFNPYGYYDSWPVEFDVYNTAPTDCWVTADKEELIKGNTVTFKCGAKDATKYTIGINKNGTRIYTEDIPTTFTKSFSDPGTYTAYVTASNYFGFQDSSKITFTVYDEKIPPKLSTKVIVTDNQYNLNTEILGLTQNAIYVAGIYDINNMLLEMQYLNIKEDTTGCGVGIHKFSNASYIKVFLWNTIENMIPLCVAENIPKSVWIKQ